MLIKYIANSKMVNEDALSMSVVHKTTKKNRLAMLLGVEEKFPEENFRVDREMGDEILVYDPFLTKI